MAHFFISYRRADSQQIVGRVHEKLADYFGEDAVFLDVQDIPSGVDFRTHIQGILSECDAVLVLIGARWLGAFEAKGDNDHLLVEIEEALMRAVPLIPVLIGETRMPSESALPVSIAQLAYRNAIALDLTREFDLDMARLIKNLDSLRASRILERQQFADYRMVEQVCSHIIESMKDAFPAENHRFGHQMQFALYNTQNFVIPMKTGISLFVYRIAQDSTSLVELHLFFTAWGHTAGVQLNVIGWVVDFFQRNPVLPAEFLINAGLDAIPPGITLRAYPGRDNALDIWRSLSDRPYQISVPYIVRVSF